MTVAEMDIVIGANVTEAIAELERLGYTVTKTGETAVVATEEMAAGFESLTGVMEIMTAVLAGVGEAVATLGRVFVEMLVITAIADGIRELVKYFFQQSEAAKEAKKANEEYQKSLDNIGESAVKSAEKEIAKFTELTVQVQDSTRSLNERLAAAGKLQEQSGYFAALSKEQILYGDIKNAIDQTTQALINNAYAQAATSKAAEAGARLYDLDLKRKTALQNLSDAQNAYNRAINTPGIGQGIVAYTNTLNRARAAVNTLEDQYFELQLEQAGFFADANKFGKLADDIDKAAEVMAKLNNEITSLNQKSTVTGGNFNTEKINDYKKAIDELLALPQTPETIKDIDDLIAKVKALGGAFGDAAKKSKEVKLSDFYNINTEHMKHDFSTAVIVPIQNAMAETKRYLGQKPEIVVPSPDYSKVIANYEIMQDKLKELGNIAGNFVTPAFDAMFNAIEGGQNAFKALEKSIEQMLLNMVKAVIEAIALAAIFSLLPGGAAFSIGSIKGIFSGLTGLGGWKVPGMAVGGIVTKPTLALIGESGPERVTPLGYESAARNAMNGEVIFTISGQNLRGMLQRADQTAYNTF
jgi:hypothetical protein